MKKTDQKTSAFFLVEVFFITSTWSATIPRRPTWITSSRARRGRVADQVDQEQPEE